MRQAKSAQPRTCAVSPLWAFVARPFPVSPRSAGSSWKPASGQIRWGPRWCWRADGHWRSRTRARSPGTTCTVRNLFFNVPVRRKFLKSDQTELRHSIKVVTSIALSQIETGFRLLHEGRELLNAPPAPRWRSGWRRCSARNGSVRACRCSSSAGSSLIGGLIQAPDSVGSSRADQYMFVNRRPFFSAFAGPCRTTGLPEHHPGIRAALVFSVHYAGSGGGGCQCPPGQTGGAFPR